MAYQSGQERRTDPYRTDGYGTPGTRPHELGTVGASSRAGWIVGIILLVLLGLIVLGAMAGGGPDGGTDIPPAATAPAIDPAVMPPAENTAPAQVPRE